MNLRIIIRFTDRGVLAYSPDHPDLSATGHTIQEAEGRLHHAIASNSLNSREQLDNRWQAFVQQHAELTF